ncbi:MAG: hypothetical protein JWL81_2087, partial [Verrucomicrobiales bacterium]|nr:hypothetical protein [Verrucomicrobiales bacterium]
MQDTMNNLPCNMHDKFDFVVGMVNAVCMPRSRPFLFPDSQAGVFHVVSRIAGKAYFLEEGEGRDEF